MDKNIKDTILRLLESNWKTCNISIERDLIDVSENNPDGWKDFIAGDKWLIKIELIS